MTTFSKTYTSKKDFLDIMGIADEKFIDLSAKIMIFTSFIAAPIAIFSAHSITPTLVLASLFPLLYIVKNKNYVIFYSSAITKTILFFFCYCLASSAWSINIKDSMYLLPRLVAIFIMAIPVIEMVKRFDEEQKKHIILALTAGCILAISLITFEIIADGILTSLVKNKRFDKFSLNYFNRGVVFLSLATWPIFLYTYTRGKKSHAIILLTLITIFIAKLQSQSAAVGIAIAALTFVFVYYTRRKGIKILMVLSIIATMSIPAIIYKNTPEKLIDILPDISGFSQQHRLYIWKFVIDKTMENPILGWGFNTSRIIPIEESDMFMLNGYRQHPLPLHPHNFELQILLETGLIGLAIYTLFIVLLLNKIRVAKISRESMACFTALCANYFVIGQAGFGIWQEWLICAGIFCTALTMTASNPKTAQRV